MCRRYQRRTRRSNFLLQRWAHAIHTCLVVARHRPRAMPWTVVRGVLRALLEPAHLQRLCGRSAVRQLRSRLSPYTFSGQRQNAPRPPDMLVCVALASKGTLVAADQVPLLLQYDRFTHSWVQTWTTNAACGSDPGVEW